MTIHLLQTSPAAPDNSYPELTDEHLLERIQAQDPQALGILHKRHATLLKTIAMRVVHNDADAEDLVQEVFLQIWTRASNYDPAKGQALGWVVTLTRRRAIDRLRKREAYFRVEERFAQEAKARGDGWTHVHEDVAQNEIGKYLEDALATLPEAQRSAIKLAYHGQMSQREVAAHTGLPLGTIKTRLELGLTKLAKLLTRLGDVLGPRGLATDA